MKTFYLLLTAFLAIGCNSKDDGSSDWEGSSSNDSGHTDSGYLASDHFPLSPAVWTYVNESEDFMIEASVVSTETVSGTEVATFEYVNVDEGNTLLFNIKWSSDSVNGIQIHGYTLSDASWVNFSQPLQIVERLVELNSSVESSVDGYAYSASFEAYENCPNLWTVDWNCMKVVITSEEPNAAPFLGTWHWAAEFGTSLFKPEGAEHPWQLASQEWIPE